MRPFFLYVQKQRVRTKTKSWRQAGLGGRRQGPDGNQKLSSIALKPNVFLTLCSFVARRRAAQARQDRRGPSRRPCLKSDPKWSRFALKPSVFLIFCSFWGRQKKILFRERIFKNQIRQT